MPFPISCYSLVFPLSFDLAKNDRIVVKNFAKSEALSFSTGIKDKVSIGDQLISFNGKSISDLRKEANNGANDSGALRQLLSFLSNRNGNQFPLGSQTNVCYKLNRPNNTQYFYRAPIVVSINSFCNLKDDSQTFRVGEQEPPTFREHLEKGIINLKHELDFKSHLETMKNTDLTSDLAFGNTFRGIPTNEAKISWKVYKKDEISLGILRLDGFDPLNTYESLQIIIDLLSNELSDTDALLIDVRNNPGGLIPFADLLPKLFTTNSRASVGRALVSPQNEFIFLNTIMNQTE